MASPLPQPELSRTSLRLQRIKAYYIYEKIRVQTMRLQYEVAQIQQTLRSIQNAVEAHTASHNYNTISTKISHSAQAVKLNTPTSTELPTGIVTDGFDPAKTITADASSTFQAPAPPTALTDAAGITAFNNDSPIAFSVVPEVLRSKLSCLTSITTDDTVLVIDTTFIASPAPIIHPLPRPPPEPDPNNEKKYRRSARIDNNRENQDDLMMIMTKRPAIDTTFIASPTPIIHPLLRPPPEPDPNNETKYH